MGIYGGTGSGLSAIPSNDLLSNITAGSAVPVGNTVSATIDAAIGSTRGSILERGASGWSLLTPGAANTFLQSAGTGADLTWAAGTSLSAIADKSVISNISGASATPVGNTLTATIDEALGSTRGSILYRGASGWTILTPGSSSFVLTSQGAGADPTWAAGGGGGSQLSHAFAAHLSAGQSFAANTQTLVNFDTVDFDVSSYYDTTNKRFLPLVGGYYNFHAFLNMTTGSTYVANNAARCSFFKNGSQIANYGQELVIIQSTVVEITVAGSCLVNLNGSTDYVTVEVTNNVASTLVGGGGTSGNCFWNGFYCGS